MIPLGLLVPLYICIHVFRQLSFALGYQQSTLALPSSYDHFADTKISLNDIVVFGDSFTDNGTSFHHFHDFY